MPPTAVIVAVATAIKSLPISSVVVIIKILQILLLLITISWYATI